jgi:hypothetical protein
MSKYTETIEVNLHSLIRVLTRTDHFNSWLAEIDKQVTDSDDILSDREAVEKYFKEAL